MANMHDAIRRIYEMLHLCKRPMPLVRDNHHDVMVIIEPTYSNFRNPYIYLDVVRIV
jgi:hypothetical protein